MSVTSDIIISDCVPRVPTQSERHVDRATAATADHAAPPLASSRTNARATAARGRLSLHDATVRLGCQLVLDRISLACEPGDFIVVVGPSGCGKSTLLNVAAGMIRPQSGAARIDGRDVAGPGPERAMVFQEHTLFPWLT